MPVTRRLPRRLRAFPSAGLDEYGQSIGGHSAASRREIVYRTQGVAFATRM